MENKISDIIRTSLENVKDLVDGNTIIGEAVSASNGTVIIPVSKVSVGVATGGLDYKGKHNADAEKGKNFGGGGGTGLSVTPVAFLIVKADGNVELLNVNCPTDANSGDSLDTIVSFIRKSPELISKIKSVFKKENNNDVSDEPGESDEE